MFMVHYYLLSLLILLRTYLFIEGGEWTEGEGERNSSRLHIEQQSQIQDSISCPKITTWVETKSQSLN